MAEIKAMNSVSLKAIKRVLDQQKESKFWDGKAHAAAVGYLAEDYFSAKAKHETSGFEQRKGFNAELNGEPWLYASNMKKRLMELKLIPVTTTETSGYE